MRSSNHTRDSRGQCRRTALQEKEALCLIRVSASNPYTITGYAAAVIKVSFQHSTQHDLFQCKHSLSQLNPEPVHWDVDGHFYVGEKEKKRMQVRVRTEKHMSFIWETRLDGF